MEFSNKGKSDLCLQQNQITPLFGKSLSYLEALDKKRGDGGELSERANERPGVSYKYKKEKGMVVRHQKAHIPGRQMHKIC
jgi:hypothetical protein